VSGLDCGDNSCMFAKDKTGMRTNGGCRCFSNAGFQRSAIGSAIMMLPELLTLREQLKEANEVIGFYAEAKGNCDEDKEYQTSGFIEFKIGKRAREYVSKYATEQEKK
jgi:uncharacterized protein Smg (DUF494 family)